MNSRKALRPELISVAGLNIRYLTLYLLLYIKIYLSNTFIEYCDIISVALKNCFLTMKF